jgi:hypothetical protein
VHVSPSVEHTHRLTSEAGVGSRPGTAARTSRQTATASGFAPFQLCFGLACGTFPFQFGALRWDCASTVPYRGRAVELIEALARRGATRTSIALRIKTV